jgi:hypothetical protein
MMIMMIYHVLPRLNHFTRKPKTVWGWVNRQTNEYYALTSVYDGNGITGYHNESNVVGQAFVIGRIDFCCKGYIFPTEQNHR